MNGLPTISFGAGYVVPDPGPFIGPVAQQQTTLTIVGPALGGGPSAGLVGPVAQQFRAWDSNDPNNLTGSEFWSQDDWRPFMAWQNDLSLSSAFENPGFPDPFARLNDFNAWVAQFDQPAGLTPSQFFDLVGKLWTLPNTVLGLTLGIVGLPFGTTIQIGDNSIQFLNYPIGPSAGGAMTFGNVQIYHNSGPVSDWVVTYNNANLVNIGVHEQGHTYQAQILGPLFIPVYVLTLLAGLPSGTIPLENAADIYAAQNGGSYPRTTPPAPQPPPSSPVP